MDTANAITQIKLLLEDIEKQERELDPEDWSGHMMLHMLAQQFRAAIEELEAIGGKVNE